VVSAVHAEGTSVLIPRLFSEGLRVLAAFGAQVANYEQPDAARRTTCGRPEQHRNIRNPKKCLRYQPSPGISPMPSSRRVGRGALARHMHCVHSLGLAAALQGARGGRRRANRIWGAGNRHQRSPSPPPPLVRGAGVIGGRRHGVGRPNTASPSLWKGPFIPIFSPQQGERAAAQRAHTKMRRNLLRHGNGALTNDSPCPYDRAQPPPVSCHIRRLGSVRWRAGHRRAGHKGPG